MWVTVRRRFASMQQPRHWQQQYSSQLSTASTDINNDNKVATEKEEAPH
jgi:hypothetical protein